VSFDILNHCTSGKQNILFLKIIIYLTLTLDTPVWIYIIIGIVSFLLVVGLIISALVVRRKWILRDVEMDKLKKEQISELTF